MSSIGVQIHGGMGFIEETGAAQHFRDSRILPIYEGTNGIQSNDFVFRKVLRDNGAEAMAFIADVKALVAELGAKPNDDLDAMITQLTSAAATVEDAPAPKRKLRWPRRRLTLRRTWRCNA